MPAGVDERGRARWDRFANTRIRRVELSTNPAELPAHWNTCTGNWLRQYVYERLTPKGKKPSFKTLLATQLVAGVWHGLFPGYALFFASSAFLFESGKVGSHSLMWGFIGFQGFGGFFPRAWLETYTSNMGKACSRATSSSLPAAPFYSSSAR